MVMGRREKGCQLPFCGGTERRTGARTHQTNTQVTHKYTHKNTRINTKIHTKHKQTHQYIRNKHTQRHTNTPRRGPSSLTKARNSQCLESAQSQAGGRGCPLRDEAKEGRRVKVEGRKTREQAPKEKCWQPGRKSKREKRKPVPSSCEFDLLPPLEELAKDCWLEATSSPPPRNKR